MNLAVDAEKELEAEERRFFIWCTMTDRGDYPIFNLGLFVAVLLRVHAKNPSVAPNLFVRRVSDFVSSTPNCPKGSWACATRKLHGNSGICLDIVKNCGNVQALVIQILESATGYAPRSFGVPTEK